MKANQSKTNKRNTNKHYEEGKQEEDRRLNRREHAGEESIEEDKRTAASGAMNQEAGEVPNSAPVYCEMDPGGTKIVVTAALDK